ncbi:MAG: MBL fold metallo-hydrolase [Ruminococcaceae bacterium]|nr:MBL fold metallo-hydrolase [Oscillospiraceae bacterium]
MPNRSFFILLQSLFRIEERKKLVSVLKICSVRSSSKGNATLIYDGEAAILADCGVSGKILDEALCEAGIEPALIKGIVVTHEHTDHTKGIGVVSRKYGIPVFATYGTWTAMQKAVGAIASENKRIFDESLSFDIGGIRVSPFSIPHDAAQPVGFTFEKDGEKVAVATDIGVMTNEIFERIKGSRVVLLESNYDLFMLEAGTYPYDLKCRIKGDCGHLCNDDAALVVKDLVSNGTKEIILGHLSQENNYPELAFETTKLCLLSHGIRVGEDVELYVAKRDGIVMSK